MRPSRLEKFKRVAARRQPDLTVVLENVTDWHNIGAVIRSCDSVGIGQIFVLNTEAHLQTKKIVIGKRTSGGARRWVDVHYYTDPVACFAHVRQSCTTVLATKLDDSAVNLYDLDLSQPTAFIFGNEHNGITEEVAAFADGNFIIPQMGMAESLNISVACAVTLFEACRQRRAKGMYEENAPLSEAAQAEVLEKFIEKNKVRERGKMTVRRTEQPDPSGSEVS